jgi:multiple antibiotic resistance protein
MPNAFGASFVTLLVLLEPVGNMSVFLSLTHRQTPKARRRTALVSVLAGAVILAFFAATGDFILAYLKITIEDLQVAGGIVLLLLALRMIAGAEVATVDDEGHNVAVVPLGTPMLAGPGTIVALMVLVDDYRSPTGRLLVALGTLAALAVLYLVFRFSAALAGRVSPTASRALSRIVGLLIAAIGVEFIATAVGEWLHNGVR